MAPENVPALPRLIAVVCGDVAFATCCEEIVDELSAFCVERVAEIKVCNDWGVIVVVLLERESCCNAVDQMEHFGK